MEEPVDLGATAELERVDRRTAAALDGALKVLLELLNHSTRKIFKFVIIFFISKLYAVSYSKQKETF